MSAWTRHGRGLGVIECARTDRRNGLYPAERLIGAAAATAPRASLAQYIFVPPGYAAADQESTQACVGWQVAQCVRIRTAAMGLEPVAPSPDAVYYQARARRYGWQGVFDGGCNPLDAWESTRKLGIVPYARWPHVVRQKNDPPPPDAYRYAADNRWLRYHWVLEMGRSRTDVVCALLASKRPVGVALQVDQALEDWTPGAEPWVRKGPVLGGHAVTLVGYDTMPNGTRVFAIANSWGSWGDHGVGLIAQQALESHETSYLVTPDISEAL